MLEDPDDPHRPRQTVSPKHVEKLDEKRVRKAIEELPDKYAEVVLCDIWGFAYDEIAEIVDIPMGTVRSRVSRGRARMTDIIAKYAPSAGESRSDS